MQPNVAAKPHAVAGRFEQRVRPHATKLLDDVACGTPLSAELSVGLLRSTKGLDVAAAAATLARL
jgi:hypothetical protein